MIVVIVKHPCSNCHHPKSFKINMLPNAVSTPPPPRIRRLNALNLYWSPFFKTNNAAPRFTRDRVRPHWHAQSSSAPAPCPPGLLSLPLPQLTLAPRETHLDAVCVGAFVRSSGLTVFSEDPGLTEKELVEEGANARMRH